MKLYDAARAPNPRRVRVFIAEKGIDIPRVQVDMARGEHKTPAFIEKNPSGKIPVLELDDGRCIAESIAICRYLEALYPEPNLMGADPYELGRIEMINRQLELEFGVPLGNSWVNGPTILRLFGPREQIAVLKERGDAQVTAFYRRMDRALSAQPFMAGDRFTVADITSICQLDFAMVACDLRPDPALRNLLSWYDRLSSRPSMKV